MNGNYSFSESANPKEIAALKKDWIEGLTCPQDGMWESFRNSAKNWGILYDDKLIGYASIGEGNQLLQFYIQPKHLMKGQVVFEEFLKTMNIKSGIVGTNNLGYLSVALHFVKELKVDSYLFRSYYEVDIEEKEGLLHECRIKDLDRIVNFCHDSMGAPKGWLNTYIGDLIKKREIFFLENRGEVIGTCEIRKSISAPAYADIGMVVSPAYRRQGYGTYLLHRAKRKAIEWGKIPICSCEKDNLGSMKSISNCGFVSMYQLLLITFR